MKNAAKHYLRHVKERERGRERESKCVSRRETCCNYLTNAPKCVC